MCSYGSFAKMGGAGAGFLRSKSEQRKDRPRRLSTKEKRLGVSLKKADVDDLGPMDAAALLASIPEADADGRGLADLRGTEARLGVKVAFCSNGHVLLVGPKAKLAKKCSALRNLLSHYHWRLSGRDVAFETMTASK